MTAALAVVIVIQGLALGAVALRLAWPVSENFGQPSGPDSIGGGLVPQDEDEETPDGSDPTIARSRGRVGFKPSGS